MCACRGCYLLFTVEGAGGVRFRAVPDRYLAFPDLRLAPGEWDALQIPVSVAFFFVNSTLDRIAAFYPGPAGATESLLPLETWDELVAAHPELGTLAPDVEAILVRSDRTTNDAECFLVPIDACYELVGRLRQLWRGFDGGTRGARRARRVLRPRANQGAMTGSLVRDRRCRAPSRTPRCRRSCLQLRITETTGTARPRARAAHARSASNRSGGSIRRSKRTGSTRCSANPPAGATRSDRSCGRTCRRRSARSPATTEVDLPVACTYDFEVAGTGYLHALAERRDPAHPVVLRYGVRPRGRRLSVEPVAWHEEASYRLPVRSGAR